MCFRPAETELPPVVCPSCEKRINRVAGELPSKCPFCKEPTEGIDAAIPDISKPEIPSASPSPSPQAPKAPGAPKAPKPPTAPPAK